MQVAVEVEEIHQKMLDVDIMVVVVDMEALKKMDILLIPHQDLPQPGVGVLLMQ